MIMKYMVQYGSLFDYYATKEEAIADALEDARRGIRTANALYQYDEKEDKYIKIGEFTRRNAR